jgi:dTDP-4-amino-4,6-dideoxygalactose transaminase
MEKTERAALEILSLPMFPELPMAHVDLVAAAVQAGCSQPASE